MKRNLLLFCTMLIVQLCSAQDGYPKQILYQTDTVVCFTPNQVNLINYNKVSFDECSALNRSYLREIDLLKKSLDQSRLASDKCESSIFYYQRMENEYIIQIEALEENQRSLKRKLKAGKLMKFVFGGVGLVGGFYIGNKSSNFITL